uniref:Putative secreted protein n=1 Tax=Anopheles triannulatus TaxID=58253 RepID=A0A2M4B4M9_9DIPT
MTRGRWSLLIHFLLYSSFPRQDHSTLRQHILIHLAAHHLHIRLCDRCDRCDLVRYCCMISLLDVLPPTDWLLGYTVRQQPLANLPIILLSFLPDLHILSPIRQRRVVYLHFLRECVKNLRPFPSSCPLHKPLVLWIV